MRLILAAFACAVLASGCSTPCEELGNRLCDCTPVGSTKAACERAVQSDIQRLNPGSDADAICSEKLRTCNEPPDVTFCDWLDGRCGKSACGMSEENWAELSAPGNVCGPPLEPPPAP
jgi:hypothetical protein